MPKISTFMLCGAINNYTGRDINAVQLFSPQVLLCPPCIPGSFSFGVAVGIVNIDTTKKHSFFFEIVDPDNKVIQKSIRSELNEHKLKIAVPVRYQGFMLCTDIRNLLINKTGEYCFKVYIDDKAIDNRSFAVYSENILNESNHK